MNTGYRRWVLFGALCCCLHVPAVLAGPQQDTEAGESAYRKGDLVAAMALWRQAAQAGYAPAQARLGDALDYAEDDAEAVQWYRKATDQGNAAGEYGLGLMYLRGKGIAKDDEKARFHILRAASQNYVPALRVMMELHRTGGAGLPVDPAEAEKWEDKMYAASGQTKPPKTPAKVEKKK